MKILQEFASFTSKQSCKKHGNSYWSAHWLPALFFNERVLKYQTLLATLLMYLMLHLTLTQWSTYTEIVGNCIPTIRVKKTIFRVVQESFDVSLPSCCLQKPSKKYLISWDYVCVYGVVFLFLLDPWPLVGKGPIRSLP